MKRSTIHTDRRKRMIVANWKLHPSAIEAARVLFTHAERAAAGARGIDVVVCAPYVYLAAGSMELQRARLGAQDVFWEQAGAYTGAVGPRMLKGMRVSHVIIGHSERREHFGETNETVRKKVRAAVSAGLHCIVCVGEKSREGDPARSAAFVKEEIEEGLRGVPKKYAKRIIMAYEPIWAVSPGGPDTPENSTEMALFIRRIFYGMFGREAARSLKVLYGGSVNAKNAEAFLREGGVDGLLVGHASISARSFSDIIHIAGRARRVRV